MLFVDTRHDPGRGEEWSEILLRVRERLYVTEKRVYEQLPGFFSIPNDVEVFRVLPEGGRELVGTIDENGIGKLVWACWPDGRIKTMRVEKIATWDEIEIVGGPEI